MSKLNLGKKLKKLDLGALIAFLIILIYSLCILYMLYFGLITSLKDNYDFALDHNVFGLPNWQEYPFSLKNFTNALKNMQVPKRGRLYASVVEQFVNGVLYSLGSALLSTVMKLLPAYFCAKYDTKFGKLLYAIAVVTMILPIVGAMASTIEVMRTLGLFNTYFGVLFYNSSYHGMYFLILYAAFKGLSNAYSEAARIDGAGHFTVLFRIYLPMVLPSAFAIGILQFIAFWNDYQTPMIYLEKMPTISYGLYRFSMSSYADNAPALLSATLLVCIPMILLFVIFKNKIMGNVTAGGLKG